MNYTEAGHRLYIKKRLAKKIEAEALATGLSMDDLILAKLNLSSSDSGNIALIKRMEKVEKSLQHMTEILKSIAEKNTTE